MGKDTTMVTHDEKSDRYSVCYQELIAPLIKAVRDLSEKCVTTKNNLSFSLTLSDVGCIASKKHNLDKKKIKGYDVMVEMKDGSLIKNGACGITFDAFITTD